MLQHLRDNSKGVVSGILIGLLVIIFALSGAEALFNRDTAEKSVVEVNGNGISEREISRAIEMRKQQILARYGESVPADFLTDENLRGPVIDYLIERQLLSQSAENSGFAISEEFVNQQIVSTPQFQTNGVFDRNLYQMVLRNAGLTPSLYRKTLTEDFMIAQLETGIVETSFVTPKAIEDIIALSFQTRDFQYILIPAQRVGEKVQVDDTEIQTYYENNSQEFTNPEQVAVDYIELSVETLSQNIEIAEDTIRRQYEQNIAAFVAAPQRHAAHILIENNDAAVIQEVQAKLAAGEDFAELARAYSDDPGSREQGGDVGFTTGDTFPAKFEEALATLSVGGVSDPVVTDAGTHFIKKLAEVGSEPPSFEEEKDKIANQLKRDQAEAQFIDLLEKLRDKSYNAESLVEVANELGLEVKNTGLFSRNNGTGIAASQLVVSAAFANDVMVEGNSSDVIELTPSHVVVLKKTDAKPAYISPLEEVRDKIAASLREQKTRQLLAAQAEELKQEIASGKTLTEVALAAGLEVITAEKVGRRDASMDRDILTQVFAMAKPRNDRLTVNSFATSSGDYAVVALTGIGSERETISPEQERAIANQLAAISGQAEYRSFQAQLQNQAKIKR